MIKTTYLAALLAALWLAACGGQTTPASNPLVAATQAGAQPTATLTLQAQQPGTTPTLAAQPAGAATEELPPVPSGCTVVTRQFSPEPTEQSLFPAVNDTDWAIGERTAALTILEYGDFQ